MFHKHKWIEKERFYAEPHGNIKGNGFEQKDIERMTMGVTTILYQCECGKVDTVEIIGKSMSGSQ